MAAKRRRLDVEWAMDVEKVERLMVELLQITAETGKLIIDALRDIDEGIRVSVDQVTDKRVRKKLRHLYDAVGLVRCSESGVTLFERPADHFTNVTEILTPVLLKAVSSLNCPLLAPVTKMESTGETRIGPQVPAEILKDHVKAHAASPSSDVEVGPLPTFCVMPASTPLATRHTWMDVPQELKSVFDSEVEQSEGNKFLREKEQTRLRDEWERLTSDRGASLLELGEGFTQRQRPHSADADGPWKSFDPEKDLGVGRGVSHREFSELVSRSKEFTARFTSTGFEASFS
ncbi:MAG: hypothetical protein KVP17_005338 [Porospora cf. gigantea B]|uniref:uncharacterized protein n=1 Tax=Porospora cf. gigantea B TaxID=2853592 RepID=UPI003571D22A|nr:MAG: hypothetical protein KVP17_005338 [Porospora cf. gigantea B]